MADQADKAGEQIEIEERLRKPAPYSIPTTPLTRCDICERPERCVNGICQTCRDSYNIR